MKYVSIPVFFVIMATCWFHIQATNFTADDELVREARNAESSLVVNADEIINKVELVLPVADKMMSEISSVADVSESRTGRQILPSSILNPALSLLIQIFADIRTNCAFFPQNLPIISCPDTLTCASYCRSTPSCTHFTQNNTDFTCRRTAIISLTTIININLLPTTQKCNCGYMLERATPPSLLSLALLIGANIL